MKIVIYIIVLLVPSICFAKEGDTEAGDDIGCDVSEVELTSACYNSQMKFDQRKEPFANYFFQSNLSSAQKGDIEIGGDIGFGISEIGIKSVDFTSRIKFNIQGEVFANYFFLDNLGVSLGLGINNIKSKATSIRYQSVISEGVDLTGDYQTLVYADDYQEIERLMMLEIPIALVFRKAISDKLSFRAGLGLKIGVPVIARYQLEEGISTRLYYPDLMASEEEAIRGIPSWGLYDDRTDWNQSSGDLETSINVAPFVNVGANYSLRDKLSLYSALYFSYGLNDVITNNGTQLLDAESTTDYVYHSPTTFTRNHTLEVGIKIGVLFDLQNYFEHKKH